MSQLSCRIQEDKEGIDCESISDFFNVDEGESISLKSDDLDEALYSFSQLNLWPDCVDSVSREQAIIVWKIVDKLRCRKFPKRFKM